jgi:hypothetical protein
MKTLLSFLLTILFISTQAQTAEELAQSQLDAYNNRDIEAFLQPYSDSVKVYTFPDQFQYQGKVNMRNGYASFFANTPELHCKLINRMVMGNTVIDQEEVTLGKGREPIYAIAIYKIAHKKINEVYFIRKEE